MAAQTTTRPIIQAYKNIIEGPQTVKCFKSIVFILVYLGVNGRNIIIGYALSDYA